MKWRYFIAACSLLVCALGAVPARAQIVSYLDEAGKRVYINSNTSPSPRATQNSSKSPSTGNASSPAASSIQETSDSSHEAIESMIREVSARYQVDPALIRAVIQTESNWNPSAVSTKGAQGLMQLVPATAQQMGVSNAFDPKQNLDGGVHYLRTLLERYNGDLDKSLAAYNAGPGAVDRAGGVPRYKETRAYVQKVTSAYNQPDPPSSVQTHTSTAPSASSATIAPRPIYRTAGTDGRVVFTNE